MNKHVTGCRSIQYLFSLKVKLFLKLALSAKSSTTRKWLRVFLKAQFSQQTLTNCHLHPPPQSAQIYLQRDFINCLKIEDKPGWMNVSDFKCNASLHSWMSSDKSSTKQQREKKRIFYRGLVWGYNKCSKTSSQIPVQQKSNILIFIHPPSCPSLKTTWFYTLHLRKLFLLSLNLSWSSDCWIGFTPGWDGMNRSDAPSLMSRLRSAIQTLGNPTERGVQTSGIKSGNSILGVTHLGIVHAYSARRWWFTA